MKAVTTPAPIVLLDTASGFVGSVIDFGGQEVRGMLVVTTPPDFAVNPAAGSVAATFIQSLDAAFLLGPASNSNSVVPAFTPVPTVSQPNSVRIVDPRSYGVFKVQAYEPNPTAITAGSYKVTFYFV